MTESFVDTDEIGRFEVTVYREGELVHTARFNDLQGAEAFMEEWSEMRPADQVAVDDQSGDHTGFELVEADTPLLDEHDPAIEDRYDDR